MTTGGQGQNPLTFPSLAAFLALFFLVLLGTKTLASKIAVNVIVTFVFMCRQPSSVYLVRPVVRYFKSMLPWGMRKKIPQACLYCEDDTSIKGIQGPLVTPC